jgi:diadenylate cyclase
MMGIFDSSLGFFNMYIKDVSDITIADVVDIALVTFFIYQFLKWAKNTRSWSLIRGIFILFFAFLIFMFFNLNTVSWILSNVFKIGGWVAAVVLFQPELRKALEELGKGGFKTAEKDEQINIEIIEAVKFLSERRIGAIIVLERHIALGEYERTGTLLDSLVSRQLLINIFIDKTPLHDGAVIIRKNRLSAAACILPVSEAELGRELGTRHRASVGISEVSDATALVVSEETGDVSYAVAGRLHRRPEFNDLLATLNSYIEKPPAKKIPFFKGLRK